MRRALALIALIVATPVSAQVFRGFDDNAPVQLEDAERIELQSRADRLVVSGNVRFSQGGLKLTADKVTIAYSRAPSAGTPAPDIKRVDATGNIVFTRGDESARGKMAIYDIDRRIITLIGDVVLIQGADRLNGERLTVDLKAGGATLDGAPTADGKPGRVSAILNPRGRK